MSDIKSNGNARIQWWAIFAMVIVTAGSLAFNVAQSSRMKVIETLGMAVTMNTSTISVNSRLIYGQEKDLAYIRQRVDEIVKTLGGTKP